MEPGLLRDALTLLAGIGTGVLSAAFGIGGATVSTPAVRALGLPALLAIGTTLPSIFPSAVSGSLRYARERMIDWRIVGLTVPFGIASSVGGARLAPRVPGEGHLLMVITALLLGFTAWRMARQPAAAGPAETAAPDGPPTPSRRPTWREGKAVLAGIGAAAGLLSGLLGLGGGVVMVPAFSEVARIPLKTAIATSLACVALFAIPGTITHALQHGIDWRFALLLAVGVIPGARIGAAAAIRTTDRRLRAAVAAFLGVVSVIYLVGELLAL